MDNIKLFQLKFSYYDYFFLQTTVVKYDLIKATSLEEATKQAYWKWGDLIEILELEEVE